MCNKKKENAFRKTNSNLNLTYSNKVKQIQKQEIITIIVNTYSLIASVLTGQIHNLTIGLLYSKVIVFTTTTA